MEKLRVGFLGGGNMTEAIVRGLVKGLLRSDQIVVSDVSAERLAQLGRELGVATTSDNEQVVRDAELIFLAVKPQVTHAVLSARIRDLLLAGDKLLVSIVAGQSVDALLRLLAVGATAPRVVRVMPNTPFLVGEGAAALCRGTGTADDVRLVERLLRACARVVVPLDSEEQLHVVTALSGSGPGYIMHVLEAMVEAGVRGGLSRAHAFQLAAQTVLGSAALAIDAHANATGTPAELRDRVTSKGGTTAAGLAVLDSYKLQDAFLDCIAAAAARSQQLARL